MVSLTKSIISGSPSLKNWILFMPFVPKESRSKAGRVPLIVNLPSVMAMLSNISGEPNPLLL